MRKRERGGIEFRELTKARGDRRVSSGRGLVSDGVEAGLWRQYQTIHQCHRTGGIYKPKLALALREIMMWRPRHMIHHVSLFYSKHVSCKTPTLNPY